MYDGMKAHYYTILKNVIVLLRDVLIDESALIKVVRYIKLERKLFREFQSSDWFWTSSGADNEMIAIVVNPLNPLKDCTGKIQP